MSGGFSLIEDQVLGSAAASITFNTGLTDYTKFRLTLYVIKDGTGGDVGLQLNGDTGSNYAYERLSADSTSLVGARATGQTSIDLDPASAIQADNLGLFTVEIAKPLTSTPARTTSSAAFMGAGPAIFFGAVVGEWNNAADLISSIAVLASAGDFAIGTRAVLEGAA
jgi:hypothetical protein